MTAVPAGVDSRVGRRPDGTDIDARRGDRVDGQAGFEQTAQVGQETIGRPPLHQVAVAGIDGDEQYSPLVRLFHVTPSVAVAFRSPTPPGTASVPTSVPLAASLARCFFRHK